MGKACVENLLKTAPTLFSDCVELSGISERQQLPGGSMAQPRIHEKSNRTLASLQQTRHVIGATNRSVAWKRDDIFLPREVEPFSEPTSRRKRDYLRIRRALV
ncbi:hypothetical protein PoB_007571400 [Plakobranchus ocellatus]|uniref:Uncharacterized protein n=1 Tax=Plakobranchus ocellatus TaxID=259542 RepID=A0AAV4DYD1_9GAST|nr:hypothetical protein PoB_007571400 [Plakobranchus ocellatus]